jgi:hypothetical protein
VSHISYLGHIALTSELEPRLRYQGYHNRRFRRIGPSFRRIVGYERQSSIIRDTATQAIPYTAVQGGTGALFQSLSDGFDGLSDGFDENLYPSDGLYHAKEDRRHQIGDGISRSTASGAWGEFLSAARTYGVEEVIIALRELAVRLRRERITVAEAKGGAMLLDLIRGLGADFIERFT